MIPPFDHRLTTVLSDLPSQDRLGMLEAKVLSLLWDLGNGTVREVENQMDRIGEPRAYTTVLTVLNRLHEKQLVSRTLEPGSGNQPRYRYAPRQSEAEWQKSKAIVALKYIVTNLPLSAIVDAVAECDVTWLDELSRMARSKRHQE
jgi:predicted transcriptional regulator